MPATVLCEDTSFIFEIVWRSEQRTDWTRKDDWARGRYLVSTIRALPVVFDPGRVGPGNASPVFLVPSLVQSEVGEVLVVASESCYGDD
ncbi:hypothetical protein BOTNAR_0317g00160 [Botryotinia narcissicola]|uniref:Uncharacterized protein n=1 Tax=Botryotinia narcissicola TaxID=278944 RepID=A0A4Z1HUQ4_9HELO|nr:hypothetical protein BOTNAR_0317g00160 [Botryotinia narcissicola]